MSLLQMSLAGAVMILVIVVIRALAIHKLPKNTFLLLWGVVLLRLLVPYSFRAVFSVYSLLDRLVPATAEGAAVPGLMVPTHPVTEAAPAGSAATVSLAPWLLIWALGAMICGLFFALAYRKCRREFQASLPVDNGYAMRWLSAHRLHRGMEIRQSDRISAPLTYGVLRPVILMPKTTDWEDADTLRYVLAHEYVHIRRFDAVTKLLLTAALCLHWFNPAVWVMYVLANRDMELSCDAAVLRQFGAGSKSAYATVLVRMEETRSGLTPLCSNFSKNAIEERIIAIMKIKKTSIFSLVLAMLVVFGVTAAFATSAQQPADEIDTSVPGSVAPDDPGAVNFTYNLTADGSAQLEEENVVITVRATDGELQQIGSGKIFTYTLAGADSDGTAYYVTPDGETYSLCTIDCSLETLDDGTSFVKLVNNNNTDGASDN